MSVVIKVEVKEIADGWYVELALTDGETVGAQDFERDPTAPFNTREEAEEAAMVWRSRIGVIDDWHVFDSRHSVAILRERDGRWHASLGLGDDSMPLPGTYNTVEEAEAAARAEARRLWERAVTDLKVRVEQAGVQPVVFAEPPDVTIVRISNVYEAQKP